MARFQSSRSVFAWLVFAGLLAIAQAIAGTSVVAAELTARDVAVKVHQATASAPVDLSGKDLSDLDLAGLNLKSAVLRQTNLYGTDLSGANLSGADLTGSKLDRATIIRTDFSGAKLEGVTMLRPNVFGDMTFATADTPDFSGANLRSARIAARLDRANFRDADLSNAVIGPADTGVEAGMAPSSRMMGVDFSGARLEGATIQNADLTFARFVGANLKGAKLVALDLTNADLSNADFTDADISGSNFKGARLEGSRGLETARGRERTSNLQLPK